MQPKLLILSLAAAGVLTYMVFGGQSAGAEQHPLASPPSAICSSGAAAPLRGPLQLAQSETEPFTAESVPARETASDQSLPPLFDGLGSLSMPVSTDSAEAQAYFNQGLRLAFAFNHAEARRAFEAAQHFDPECAMCYWGEALVLGPNINVPMFPEALAPAYEAISHARELAASASPVEQALIAALTERYASSDDDAERDALDQAYAEAMGEAAARFPQHDTLQTLYAESLMMLSPWDYWRDDGTRPKAHTAELVSVLESVLARDPEHPGAIHLYIHAVEASDRPERAEPYAERLADLMPGAGHIVHMPSHIYYRVGRYADALQANVDAVAADERYFSAAESDPIYRFGYYPHNLHFMLAAAQMGGDGQTAIEAAEKLDAVLDTDFVREAPALEPVKAAPYLAHSMFSDSDTVFALAAPPEELTLVTALWRYARAVTLAWEGEIDHAQRELEQLQTLRAEADVSPIEQAGVPAAQVLATAEHVVRARLAEARDELPRAVEHYREAVASQDDLAYMEPPFWHYPVRQSLGAVLLRMGELEAAGNVFRESLENVPDNGWALAGLEQVYREQGRDAQAERTAAHFQRVWLGDAPPTLERL